MKKSYIYMWEGGFLYYGGAISTRPHAHHALQIGISMGMPFRMNVGGDEWNSSHGIIIRPDSDHECVAPGKDLVYISIDPESSRAKKLYKSFLQEEQYFLLPERFIKSFRTRLKKEFNNPENSQGIAGAIEKFIDTLLAETYPEKHSSLSADDRIMSVLQMLKKSGDERVYLKEVAGHVGLSEGRLVHLFKQVVGIPMRRYILWLRLNNALLEIIREKNLTDAAHHAGFSDSAHFSRTFLRNFGVSPSEFLKNSQIIQAFHVSL